MGAAKEGRIVPAALVDDDGNLVAVIISGGIRRLAVDAIIAGPVVIGGVELDDGGGGATRAQIHADGAANNAGPNDGGLLVSGRDGASSFHVRQAVMSALADEALRGLLTKALAHGVDSEQAVGSQVAPVAARNADAPADFDEALRGLVVNARLGANAQDFVTDTTTPLGAGGTFTTASKDMKNHADLGLSVFVTAGVGSLNVTVEAQESFDGVTFRVTETVVLTGAVGASASLSRVYSATRRHMRARVVNNDGANALAVTEVGTVRKPLG